MTTDWEDIKEDIRQLYLEQGLTCTEVMLEMQRRGFHRSTRSYKNCFKRWGFRKAERRPGDLGTLSRGLSIDQAMPADQDDTPSSPSSDHAGLMYSQANNLVSFAPNTTVAYPTSPGAQVSDHPEIEEPVSMFDGTFADFPFLLNFQDESGYTMLHRAVMNEQTDEVIALLSEGAAIDVEDWKGNLPVHYTADHQDEKIVKLLLGYRVSEIEPMVKQDFARLTLDHRNADGNTPLHLAISARSLNGDPETSIVTHLLRAGANPHVANDFGMTPICRAVELVSPTMSWNHGHQIDKMLNAKATEFTTEKITSLFKLFLAESYHAWVDVKSHLNALFRTFLGNGADPDVPIGPSSQRLLTYFLNYCHKSGAQNCDLRLAALICQKLDVARVNSIGDTCVHELIRFLGTWYPNPSIYQLLQIVAERGADVNQLNMARKSPLMLLMERRQLVDEVYPVLIFLLSRGANPLIPDAAGNFPIYVAVRNNPYLGSKLAKIILHVDNGLDTIISWQSTWWQSWMHAITSKNWDKSVTLLQQARHSLPPDVQAQLYRLALAVLAEKHLRRAKDWYQNSEKSPEQQYLHRAIVRNILLKSEGLDIDPEWFLYLLKL